MPYMKPNRRELAVLRGKRDPSSLELWAATFGGGNEKKARRYALAIATFLGTPTGEGQDYLGQFSPNTRKAYAFAITEFFEWAAAVHGKVVAPEHVTRKDAEDYVSWLANRPFSLTAEKLKDGDRDDQLKFFEIVKKAGRATLRDVIKGLDSETRTKFFGSGDTSNRVNRQVLSERLRELVTLDVLKSSPTVCALRKDHPQAGITQFEVSFGGRLMNLEDVYTYEVDVLEGLSRTSIAQRIAGLSSFWDVMLQGENISGGEALLQYNIWKGVAKRVNRGLPSEKKAAARRQKVPSEAIKQMLRNAPSGNLVELRNRAMLYLMIFTGIRTTELLMLRAGRPEGKHWKAWFDGSEPPAMQLVRKGGKLQRLPYPPVALATYVEFQAELRKRSAKAGSQYEDPEGEHYISREDVAWYYRDLQLPDAPMFPPLFMWGVNKRKDYRASMTRDSVSKILHRMASEAGLSESLCNQMHPHAIRHFAANAMAEGGKELREIQAMFGHASLMTTEGYLEDIDSDVRLSGQKEVLEYLNIQGEEVEPVHAGPQQEEVFDVVGIEISDEDPEVSNEEVAILQQLEESIPEHRLPEAPPEYDPEATAVLTPEGETVIESEGQIMGLDGGIPAEEILDDLASTVITGKSPGSPTWVYEQMADPKSRHETVVFNRGGERDKDWLDEHYPKMPPNFGVGHESYLPWYVKVPGQITRSGYSKGMPPFPMLAPEQVNPETEVGLAFIEQVEQRYSQFVHGDPARGILPSPMRSVGLVRWYSFFAYHTQRMENHFNQEFKAATPNWEPFDVVVEIGDFRAHDGRWLIQWLEDNAHTYRASVDAMKRGVVRSKGDVTDSFLKSSFEGIELITDVPEWMVEDDPVRALWKSDAKEWREMIAWLKNVTGQKLEPRRKVDREEQEEFADEAMKAKARNVRDILLRMVRHVDKLEHAKKTQREKVKEYRDQVRTDLVWYALTASGKQVLGHTLDQFKAMNTKDFNVAMSEEYSKSGIPDPNAPEYKKLRGKARVSAMVAAMFPELPELLEPNIFAESELFNPKWFRIDEKNHTIQIDDAERDRLIRQFGQDPELLVRRATRAMWEARDKGHEALWGVMMSYFSWIVPSGREMEAQVRGIPVPELPSEDLNIQARKNWLKAWVKRMKDLASGKVQVGEVEEDEPEWKKFLREEEGSGMDAMDHIATDALDFVSVSSIDGYVSESPEDLLMGMEEDQDFLPNKFRRGLLRNGKGTYVHLGGEKPRGWYQVDLYGSRKGYFRPNAPPQFMSPGAVYQTQKRVFPARQMLPSPFRMVSAMDLTT